MTDSRLTEPEKRPSLLAFFILLAVLLGLGAWLLIETEREGEAVGPGSSGFDPK